MYFNAVGTNCPGHMDPHHLAVVTKTKN
jgi:hypothetical protein